MPSWNVLLSSGNSYTVDALNRVGAELRALALDDELFRAGRKDFAIKVIKSYLV